MTTCPAPGEADVYTELVMFDCEFVLLSVHRDAVTQIAGLLELIGASEHSELVIREHTLKVNL